MRISSATAIAGMGVVELNGGVVAERADVAVLLDVTADEIEQRGGGEEILLPQAQLLASRRRVARVENLGDRLARARESDKAPTKSPALKASSLNGSGARADHRRSVLTCLPRQPTIGVS